MTRVDGVDYTPSGVEDIRQQVIILRDGAIKQSDFTWAVILSHTIAYLAEYADLLKEREAKGA